MGGVGRQNPVPVQVGGGRTEIEEIWLALRGALGNAPGPVLGLEDSWRWAKAEAIAGAIRADYRAVMQRFPSRSTDHLPVWEENLKVPREATDAERRDAIQEAWTFVTSALWPELGTRLNAIDSTITLVVQDDDHSIQFQPGKYLGDDATPIQSSDFPTFSSHFILTVLWPGGIPDGVKRAQVEDLLNAALPSWVDWRIVNALGFFLDGFNDSRLDLTAFS